MRPKWESAGRNIYHLKSSFESLVALFAMWTAWRVRRLTQTSGELCSLGVANHDDEHLVAPSTTLVLCHPCSVQHRVHADFFSDCLAGWLSAAFVCV